MGQYWLFRDMDARTSMDLAKLGESYFGVGEDLHKMLCRVPIPASITLHPEGRPEHELSFDVNRQRHASH